jgi:voltage-gated potassium channel
MNSFDFEGHIVVCEWNHRAKDILQELRSDQRTKTVPIVLIAERETKPVDDDQLFFVKGSVNEENLTRANVAEAATVIILGDYSLDPSARDAKAVLATLTVESMNPEAYSVVELVDSTNAQHCQRANADEIIVGGEFTSKLISRAAVDHGISTVLADLLSSLLGKSDISKIPVPEPMIGRSFMEIFTEMKDSSDIIVLAVEKGNDGQIMCNPPKQHRLEMGDNLIVVSEAEASLPS